MPTKYEQSTTEETRQKVKPIGDLHSVPHFRCGVCKRAIVLYENDQKPDSCRWCGTKVDWNNC